MNKNDTHYVKKLGNYACNFGQAYSVVDSNYIAPCVLEQHGAITGVIELFALNNIKTNKNEIKTNK